MASPLPPPAPPLSQPAPQSAPPAPPQTLDDSPEDIIRAVATAQGVDPDLQLSIAQVESSMNPNTPRSLVKGKPGAIGLMQLMPETAARHKVNPNDPYENALGGAMELRDLRDAYGGDLEMMTRRYNGHGPETTDYARKVLTEYERRKGFAPGTLTSQLSPNDPETPPITKQGQPQSPAGAPPAPPPVVPGWEAQHPISTMLASMINDEPVPANATPAEAAIYHAGAGTAKFLQEATTSLNPVNIAKGIGSVLTTDPRTTLRNLWDAHAKVRDEGQQLMDQARASHDFGKSLEGLTRIGEGMIPLFGPRIAEADKYLRSGEYARGAGALTDVAGQILGPKYLEDSRVLPRAFPPRLNPNEAAAVDLGLANPKLPIDVATASGSPFALKLQRAVEATPSGSPAAERTALARGEEMPQIADRLAAPVHGTAVTPHQAGVDLQGGVQSYIKNQNAVADTNYEAVRAAEADPANTQSVQVGTRKDWHPSGNGTLIDTPIMEDMPLPADLRPAKAALQPVWDRLMRNPTAATLKDASPGLQAIKAVVQGPDFMRASDLDTILSSVKALARGADMPELRTVAQGLSAKVVSTLEDAHVDAIANAGPDVVKALRAGRDATIAKHAAEEVLGKLKDEPVLTTQGAVTPRADAGIEHLRDLQRLAPQEMPKVARAFLEELFASGTAEGGWKGATGLEARWKRLGPQTKQLLFGASAPDLDRFFLLGKMLERTPNASGTALTLTGVGSLTAAIRNPGVGIPALLGAGTIAKVMNSRAGVRLLTKGLTLPADSAAATAWSAALAEQLGKVNRRDGKGDGGGSPQVATPSPTLPGLSTGGRVGTPPPPPTDINLPR